MHHTHFLFQLQHLEAVSESGCNANLRIFRLDHHVPTLHCGDHLKLKVWKGVVRHILDIENLELEIQLSSHS